MSLNQFVYAGGSPVTFADSTGGAPVCRDCTPEDEHETIQAWANAMNGGYSSTSDWGGGLSSSGASKNVLLNEVLSAAEGLAVGLIGAARRTEGLDVYHRALAWAKRGSETICMREVCTAEAIEGSWLGRLVRSPMWRSGALRWAGRALFAAGVATDVVSEVASGESVGEAVGRTATKAAGSWAAAGVVSLVLGCGEAGGPAGALACGIFMGLASWAGWRGGEALANALLSGSGGFFESIYEPLEWDRTVAA
jgi:hypothetical protein